MAIRLSVRGPGAEEPTDLDFDQSRVRIGRGAHCDVRLPRPTVSAVHAMVLLDRDRYYVVDVGSTNGTTLADTTLVTERRKLIRTGDVIGIGGFEIRFQAGVAVLKPHSQERTVAAARQLARQVMTAGGLELRNPSLVVLGGPQQGERFEIPPAPATLRIGRSEDCDVPLVDGEVSREHVEVEVGVEGVTVRDLGGKNPIRIGDREVSRGRLHDRDELVVGSTVLVFEEPVEAFLRVMAERPEAETERSAVVAPSPAARSSSGEEDLADGAADEADGSRTAKIGAGEGAERQPSTAPGSASTGSASGNVGGEAKGEGEAREQPGTAPTPRRAGRRWGTPGSEVAVLLVGALALAACVAALVWLFR